MWTQNMRMTRTAMIESSSGYLILCYRSHILKFSTSKSTAYPRISPCIASPRISRAFLQASRPFYQKIENCTFRSSMHFLHISSSQYISSIHRPQIFIPLPTYETTNLRIYDLRNISILQSQIISIIQINIFTHFKESNQRQQASHIIFISESCAVI